MSDDHVEARQRRWPAALLLAAAIVWLGVAAALLVTGAQDFGNLSAASPRELAVVLASFVLKLLPPLAVAVLAFAIVRRQQPTARAALEAIEDRQRAAAAATAATAADLATLEATLARIGGQIAGLRDAAASESDGLAGSAARLETAAARLVDSAAQVHGAGASLATALPDADGRAGRLGELLARTAAETTRQASEIETMLAGLWTASDDAASRHQKLTDAARARLLELAEAGDRVGAGVDERTAAIGRAADAAFDATSAALDTTRAGVEAQTAALLASVDQARVALDHIGGEAARAMQQRLDRLIEAAAQLGQSLGEQDRRSQAFIETVERGFGVLEAKLGNAAASGNSTLDTLAQRLQAVRDQVHTLAAPLSGAYDAVAEIEAGVARLEAAAAATLETVGRDLPATHAGIAALAETAGEVRSHVTALLAPVEAADLTTRRIAEGLEGAHAAAKAVESAAGTDALAAANQLIEVLGRVREVAAATAGTMRETLAGVVAEAEAALADAGTTTARTAFAEPIRAELAEVQGVADRAAEAAQAAAERVSQRLLGLTQTVAAVEARIDAVDTRYEVNARNDLARRSEELIAKLGSVAIDVAGLLQLDVGDTAWTEYLKGDRSIFARRAVRLLDAAAVKKIERHFEHDEPFRTQATRYITDFENLLKGVLPDRDGNTLAVALLSSDLGKLYVILAQATERLRA